jgi:membrane-associated phospholipid phosphatase
MDLGIVHPAASWLTDVWLALSRYGIFVEGVLAAMIVFSSLYPRPRVDTVRWIIYAAVTGGVSLTLALIGTTVYFVRPFHQIGAVTPDTPNSFPSHHALVAGFLVVLVGAVRPVWAWPLAALAVGVDIGLVVTGSHWAIDVAGSTAFVVVGTVVAQVVTPRIDAWVAPPLLSLSDALDMGSAASDAVAAETHSIDGLEETIARHAEELAGLRREVEHLRVIVESLGAAAGRR